MNTLPTVTIRRDDMDVRINASDYDAERDGPLVQDGGQGEPAPMLQTNQPGASIGAVTVQDGPQDGETASGDTVPPANSPEAVSAGPVPSAVVKKGRKYIVTDAQGNPVTAAGIDPAGYGDEAAAWAAIMGAQS